MLRDDQRAAVTDAVSRRLLPLIPTANGIGPSGEGRFVGSATAPVDIDQWTGDIRHNISNAAGLHWYYAFQRDQRGEPTLQLNTIPGFGDTRQSTRQIMTLNETHIFGSNLVNEARFGFNRIGITFEPNAQLNPTDYGINNGVTTAIGIPQITIVGLGLNFGGPSNFPQGRTDTSFVFSDSASYQREHHAFKFGGEFRHIRNDNFTSDTGTFQFGSLAAFQTGLGNNFAITLGDRPSNVRQQAIGLFLQDKIQASPSVTLDLGLRYDGIMGPTETDGRYVVFDTATSSLVRTANPYQTGHNLQPRVGVIWSPSKDGRTVVRGAYAVMVDMPVTNVVSVTSSNPPLAVPLTFAGNIRLDSAATTALASGLAPNTVDPDFTSGRMQTWNVNVERQIGPALGVMAGYFGSHGDRLRITRNVNQFVNGVRPFPRLSPTSPILPGGALGNITETASLGWSNYKGLWLTANQRPTKGLQFNASYTLSRSTDTNSLSTGAIVVQDSNNIADSEGPSDFDVRHRFVINAIYELPFKGNRAVDGWQLSIVTQAQTGSPVNIITGINTFTGVNNTLRPDLLGDPSDPRISGAVVQQQCVRPENCDRRGIVWRGRGVRLTRVGGRRVSLRQSRPKRRIRAGLQQHGLLGDQEPDAVGSRAPAVSHRGVQHLQPGQPGAAGPHRHGGQHVVRRDHQHTVPDRRLWVGPADPVRDQSAVLEAVVNRRAGRQIESATESRRHRRAAPRRRVESQSISAHADERGPTVAFPLRLCGKAFRDAISA